MIYGLLADLVALVHLSFVLFAVFGGFAVYRWRRILIPHLAAVVWAVIVEVFGLLCPLTPLENRFRRLAGQEGYEADFVDRYLMQLLYPEGLTKEMQIWLACAVLAINVLVYVFIWKRLRGE